MTKERAKDLLSRLRFGAFPYAFPRSYQFNGGPIDPEGITREEDREIKEFWERLPGNTRYFDAVVLISQGKTIRDFA